MMVRSGSIQHGFREIFDKLLDDFIVIVWSKIVFSSVTPYDNHKNHLNILMRVD
jgi:hypothetical protein